MGTPTVARTRRCVALVFLACSVVGGIALTDVAADAATSRPKLTATIAKQGEAVRLKWSFDTDARRRDRELVIQRRRVNELAFVTIITRPHAAAKNSVLDKSAPTTRTEYRARVTVNGVATPWSDIAVVDPGQAPVTTTTAPSGGGGQPDDDSWLVYKAGQSACPNGWEDDVIALINARRPGLPQLRRNADLMQATRARVIENGAAGRMSHQDPLPHHILAARYGYTYPPKWAYGETLGQWYTSPQDVVNGWWGSPGHKAILTKDFVNEIGVGCIKQGTRYWWAAIVGQG